MIAEIRQRIRDAFEPVPATYERLCANLRLNDLVGRVTPLNQGVGETAGTLRFSSGLNAMNHVLGPGESDPRGVDVTVTTLDAAIGESATLMKMDVEGFETPALAGAARTLADPSLHSIIIELNGSGARYGYDDQKIAEKLQSLGFALYDYDPFTRRLAPSSDYSFQHGNALFIRDFERAQQLVQTAPKFRVLDRDV